MFAFMDEDTPNFDFGDEDMRMMRQSIAKRNKDFYGGDEKKDEDYLQTVPEDEEESKQ